MEDTERQRDVCNAYESTLLELTCNSKPMINVLTMLADENKEYASHIVRILEGRLRSVKIDMRLPVLYLIDSIVKNVGKEYLELFTQNLVSNFSHVFAEADEKMRHSLGKLRKTWDGIFPAKKLTAIDSKMHQIDKKWPAPAKSIHINPRFIENKGQPQKFEEERRSPKREIIPVKGNDSWHDEGRRSRFPAPEAHHHSSVPEFMARPPHCDYPVIDAPIFEPDGGHMPIRDAFGPVHEFRGPPPMFVDEWGCPQYEYGDMHHPYPHAQDWQEPSPYFDDGPPRPMYPPRKRGIMDEDPRIEKKRPKRNTVKVTERDGVEHPPRRRSKKSNNSARNTEKATDNGDGSKNIKNLVEELIKKGMLPKTGSPNPTQNAAVPQLAFKEEDLKRSYPSTIEKLYKCKQCSMCGERFSNSSSGDKSAYSDHLDWHFKFNRRKNDSKRKRSRPWYFLLEDWTTCEDFDDPDKGALSKYFEETKRKEEVNEKSLSSLACKLLPNEKDQYCTLCHEAFTDKFWEETDEEWHFRNALMANGKASIIAHAYHATCYDDAVENTLLDADNDNVEKKLKEDLNAVDDNDDKTILNKSNKTGSFDDSIERPR